MKFHTSGFAWRLTPLTRAKNISKKVAGAFALPLLLLAGFAAALPLLQGTTSNPTGFTGIVVDGTTYNVTFTADPYQIAFASQPPAFFANPTGADHATDALVSALTGAGVTGLLDVSCLTIQQGRVQQACQLITPTGYFSISGIASGQVASLSNPFAFAWENFHSGGAPDSTMGSTCGNNFKWDSGSCGVVEFAVFTALPSSVPEPGTLLLLGVAACALVGTRRFRRRAS